MAEFASAFTDYVNYRLQRKAQIREYIMAQAAQTPQLIQQQWRFLQAEMEAAAALDKSIEDMRRRVQQGIDTKIEAATRAEGTARTALIQAQGAASVAQIQAEGDLKEAMIRARAQTIPEELDRLEQSASAGSASRVDALRSAGLASKGSEDRKILDSIGVVLDSQYGTRILQAQDPLQRAVLLREAARGTEIALAAAGSDPASAAALMQQKFGVAPGDYSPDAVSAARAAAQARVEAGLGGTSVRGGTAASSGAIPRPPTRAELVNTDEAGLDALAARAAISKLAIERPDFLAGKTPEQIQSDPAFQAEVRFMRDAAPLVDLLTYGDDRTIALLRQRQDAEQRVLTARSELRRMQQDLPDIRDVEDRTTLAFADLYGSPRAKAAAEGVRASVEELRAKSAAAAERAAAEFPAPPDETAAQMEDRRRKIEARTQEYMTTIMTPPPAAGISTRAMRQLPASDQQQVRADLAAQTAERDWWDRLAAQPPAAEAQSVDLGTLEGLQKSGFRPTADNTGDLFGDVNGRTVRVTDRLQDTSQGATPALPSGMVPDTGDAVREQQKRASEAALSTPEPLDMGDFEIVIPRGTQPADSEPAQPGVGEFVITPRDQLLTPPAQTPPAEGDGRPANPRPRQLVMPDEAVPWLRRSVDEDPVLQIPLILRDGMSFDDLTPRDQGRVQAAVQRLNEDFVETKEIFDKSELGSEAKADAALHLQDILKVAQRVERAQKTPRTAKQIEQRRVVRSADAGTTMAADAVKPSSAENPAAFLKSQFGKNVLRPADIQLVRELARSQYAPTGQELAAQLMRIAGNRWIRTDVREQLRALFVAEVEAQKAVTGRG